MQVTRYSSRHKPARPPVAVAYHALMRSHGRAGPGRDGTADASPLAVTLERIGDRWSLQVVEALLGRAARYAELQAAVAGIAPNILAARLRRLEADGLIVSTAYAERPPRFEYRLTTEGRALAGALRLLAEWGVRQAGAAAGEGDSMRHEACGTALEARWFCPTCGEIVEANADDMGRRV
jgi:DNA-binding HxlR family transcriptional regulator